MTDFRPRGFQVLPPIVKNLVIINVIMVVLQFVLWSTFKINLQTYLGLHYWRSDLFKPWQVITHIFMHGNPMNIQETFMHIFLNMLALWMFGSILENIWGPKRFLTFYMVCGIGAALCYMATLAVQYEPLYKSYMLFKSSATLDHFQQFLSTNGLASDKNFMNDWMNNQGDGAFSSEAQRLANGFVNDKFDIPMVGASGAVFGILFAFAYLFPNTLIYLYFFVPIKAKWLIGAYAVFELFSGFLNAQDDNVAHFAHLGGMLFAFILLKIWDSRYKQRFY